mgnify:CR=1 FL=1
MLLCPQCHRLIDEHPTQFNVDTLEKYKQNTWRQRVLEQIANLRGPRTARIMAAYAERRPFGTLVHNYFAAAPELLTGLRRVKAVEPHRASLERLEARLGLPRTKTRPSKRH